MIEFNDLTPLENTEIVKFTDWTDYLQWTELKDNGLGIQVVSAFYAAVFNRVVCQRPIEVDPWIAQSRADWDPLFTSIVCLRPKNHSGKCVCWLPKFGVVSK